MFIPGIMLTQDILEIDRKLKAYDPQLFIMFNPATERFEIWRENPDEPSLVCVVENEDGSFRPLDARVLDEVAKRDVWRRGFDAIARDVDEENERIMREADRKVDEVSEEAADRLFHAFRKAGVIT